MKCYNEPCHPSDQQVESVFFPEDEVTQKKAWGGSVHNSVNAPFVDAEAIFFTVNTMVFAVTSHFYILLSWHTPQIRYLLLTHTIESTLQSTFVASSKMLISGNQETVSFLLITSDSTTHYASEVNYQQNESKIGPQS